jgi:membrane-bound lytic murein transglycosylase B
LILRFAAIALALLAPAASSAQTPVDAAPAVEAPPEPSTEMRFQKWLADFRARAAGEGISAGTLSSALDRVTYSPRVVELDRAQPDDSRPQSVPLFSDYLAARLVPARINPGKRLAAELDPTLRAVQARYGVPPEIMLGIWGMETSYGGYTGNFDLVRSLASLAFDGRREALFTRELIAALRMIDSGVPRSRLVGSWAGATGNPQFLPSSYLTHAVDFDGDGTADIWQSRADTAASIANYLKNNGWVTGGDWAMRVSVPAALDRMRVVNTVEPKSCTRVLAKHSRWIPVKEWRALGLQPLDGRTWPADDTLATLVEPDGPGKGAYLAYGNFRALLAYNCSNFYALSVGLLADQLRSGG